jgi:hypothetical protein
MRCRSHDRGSFPIGCFADMMLCVRYASSRGGVTIGNGAVIGAGSVITKCIPPGTMALGIPARVVQKLTEAAPPEVNATVKTLSEAMAYGRQLGSKEEAELTRLSRTLRNRRRRPSPDQDLDLDLNLDSDHLPNSSAPNASLRGGNGCSWRHLRSGMITLVAISGVVSILLSVGFIAGILLGAKKFSTIVESPLAEALSGVGL